MDHIVTITINLVDMDSEQLATTLENLAQLIRNNGMDNVGDVDAIEGPTCVVGTIVYS
jgi:flagellar motor switch protein FliG